MLLRNSNNNTDSRQKMLDLVAHIKKVPTGFLQGFASDYQGRVGNEFDSKLPLEERLGRLTATASESTPYTMGILGGAKGFTKTISKIPTINKSELKQFVKNIGDVLEGKVSQAIIAKDKDLLVKLATLEEGLPENYGLAHILKHIDQNNFTQNDIYRLAELISTATQKAKKGKKVYYRKQENPLIGNLISVVANNPDIGRVITAFRATKRELRKIFPGKTD